MPDSRNIEAAYFAARERFAELRVDTEAALNQLATVSISLHCWQGDDVGGFEAPGGTLGDGLAVTGNYPGKARSPAELRSNLDKVFSLLPGRHRLNLHASYADLPNAGLGRDRDSVGADQFRDWIDWAKTSRVGLDFNQTYFAHPKVRGGFTLTHRDPAIRRFWIEHGIRCREIGAAFGKALGTPCLTNLWIPDGMKDTPIDRAGPRERLLESLDEIFRPKFDRAHNLDSVEPKLFGIGAESYTPGSHEFYLGYAISRQLLLTLDAGHYHPTEGIADKISAVLCFLPEIALHVSRGVRWDSDHVVTLTDDLQAIAQEIVWGGHLASASSPGPGAPSASRPAGTGIQRVRIGLDYFDASINRVAAWVIGSRNMLRALLAALLAPLARLREAEESGDYTARLALLEEAKLLPVGAVWDHYCETKGIPVAESWLNEVRAYEKDVLSRR
ncbi:MAG: L-rhamnose isomerase [Limisphaerales bacterium]